jgi:uncharacterized protein (TIGR03437 family)
MFCRIALFLLCVRLFAQVPFTRFVVFGDSLSDNGTFLYGSTLLGEPQPLPPLYATGEYTDGAGSVPSTSGPLGLWIEQLATKLNLPVPQPYPKGGTNYACATAETGTNPAFSPTKPSVPYLTDQVNLFLATNHTPPVNALYTFWGGGDDIFAGLDPATAVSNIQGNIDTLATAGAKYFFWSNQPPLGETPEYINTSNRSTLDAASVTYNNAWTNAIAQLKTKHPGITIIAFDAYSLFFLVTQNPSLYGLANVSTPAQGLTGVDPNTYFWWDPIHPTTAVHAGIASAAYNAIESDSGTPTISNIENNSSMVPPGFPNSGVAPSTLIVIHGSNLADAGTPAILFNVGLTPLPLSLDGTTVSVTVNGVTTHPAIYYTSPTQIDAVLPAATPVGTGTLTVTYNGTPSAPAPIQVVPSALGIDNYNGGAGVATDAVSYALLTPASSGEPGEFITLWGTGLGADPGGSSSDTTSLSTLRPVSANLQIYIGGVQATNITYQGGTVYPGVDIIIVQIPASVPTGCYVPVVGVVGSVVSNTATIPIAASGGVCSDPAYGTSGNQVTTLNGQSTVNRGNLIVAQSTSTAGQTTGGAQAVFQQVSGAGTSYSGGSVISLGGCILNQGATSSSTTTGLNAGTVTVAGPSGSPITLTSSPSVVGSYSVALPAGTIPTAGGSFTFSGSGATGGVGQFSATVSFPNPLLAWTNQNAAATITRTSGLQVTWTGGASGSYVAIEGSASAGGVNGRYTCVTTQSAGQFTVPAYILLGLPAGAGTTLVENVTNFTTFSATGLDYGRAYAAVEVQVNSTYQ